MTQSHLRSDDAAMNSKDLFDMALVALEAEDQSLQASFAQSPASGAHGLTYWVFENTLVYFIFKSWLPKTDVVWEHASKQVGPGAHQKCDLVILDSHVAVGAFEAKWWNTNDPKTWRALVDDASKLRRNFSSKQCEKYLLTFWWGQLKDWIQDVTDAEAACKKAPRLHLVEKGKFDTKLADGTTGYFAMGLVRVED